MDYSVRKAVKEDMKQVWALIKELAIFENEPDAVEVTVADLENDGFSKHPKFEVFVAELENEIVGIALFYYRYSTWKGPTIHLEDLVVREHKRGLGIGKAL
jgi:GNAT superfamily N-acetyltransferase